MTGGRARVAGARAAPHFARRGSVRRTRALPPEGRRWRRGFLARLLLRRMASLPGTVGSRHRKHRAAAVTRRVAIALCRLPLADLGWPSVAHCGAAGQRWRSGHDRSLPPRDTSLPTPPTATRRPEAVSYTHLTLPTSDLV